MRYSPTTFIVCLFLVMQYADGLLGLFFQPAVFRLASLGLLVLAALGLQRKKLNLSTVIAIAALFFYLVVDLLGVLEANLPIRRWAIDFSGAVVFFSLLVVMSAATLEQVQAFKRTAHVLLIANLVAVIFQKYVLMGLVDEEVGSELAGFMGNSSALLGGSMLALFLTIKASPSPEISRVELALFFLASIILAFAGARLGAVMVAAAVLGTVVQVYGFRVALKYFAGTIGVVLGISVLSTTFHEDIAALISAFDASDQGNTGRLLYWQYFLEEVQIQWNLLRQHDNLMHHLRPNNTDHFESSFIAAYVAGGVLGTVSLFFMFPVALVSRKPAAALLPTTIFLLQSILTPAFFSHIVLSYLAVGVSSSNRRID